MFMKAVSENMSDSDQMAEVAGSIDSTQALVKYIRPTVGSTYDPGFIEFNSGRDLVTVYNRCFDR